MLDKNRPYNRTAIDRVFSKRKAELHREAVLRGGNGIALLTDCYTGNVLNGGDPYDYEHIRSAESIFIKYRDKLTDDEIAEVVNCRGNLAATLRTINLSKNKSLMEDWMDSDKNVRDFGICKNSTLAAVRNADAAINDCVAEILNKHR